MNTDATPLNWANHNGWFMDFPGAGEAVLSDLSLNAGILSFVTVCPDSTATGQLTSCTLTTSSAFYGIDPISGQPERDFQGSVTRGNIKTLIAAKRISDQKVRMVMDRTPRAFARTCRSGTPGCICQNNICTKDTTVTTCTPGQRAKRLVGGNTDTTLCSDAAPRMQWREVPGSRQ